MKTLRQLIVVLGDQLNRDSLAFKRFDPDQDAVWMAEASYESTNVWTHKQRIALFLSGMRHFRDGLHADGLNVYYHQLAGTDTSIGGLLSADLVRLQPQRVVVVHPGEWRILECLKEVCSASSMELQILEDRHFFTTSEDFKQHAEVRKSLRMEFFYRELRKRFDILMDAGQPVGGQWNYDTSNRGTFGRAGPQDWNAGPAFAPDAITRQVFSEVEQRFAEHPGSLKSFAWPVTREDALLALGAFIEERLPNFGKFQDAMWSNEPWLYHSWISSSLNLKLLDPREVVAAAEAAYYDGRAPLPAVEGFIRQILGWREYVRGIYWHHMPNYLEQNAMNADADLPDFYWTGETELECLRQAIGQSLEHGYAHHIQRLMVTGLFAHLLGVNPKRVHEWYLAIYVDAVEWVELPNTLGMSQYADGGLMASKPYIASGKYIQRMSNYCSTCPKDPAQRTGPNACPFTTLYWEYLMRHEKTLRGNPRMAFQVRNLARIKSTERDTISETAASLREQINQEALQLR